MDEQQIISWLESEDAKSRPCRAERMGFLLNRFGNGGYIQFFGGIVPAQAHEEARISYLAGSYISCVIACQIVIEHMLMGWFNLVGRDDLKSAGFQTLCKAAREDGFVSPAEHDALEGLRELRNPYTHSKPIMSKSCFIRRAAESRNHPIELFKQDAEAALIVMSSLLSRYPFSIGEDDDPQNDSTCAEPLPDSTKS